MIRSLLALSLLVGCAAEPGPALPDNTVPADVATVNDAAAVVAPANVAAEAVEPALAVEGEGLRLINRENGAARPLAFGTPRDTLLAALAFRGPPGTGTNGECGAGPLDYASWPDGMTVYFQRGDFAGWALDGRANGALATAAGIGPGSTRAALEDAYNARFEQTTLGTEFSAGEFYGLLEGDGANATIANMWAGVSCNFR